MKIQHTKSCPDTVMLAKYFGKTLSEEEKNEMEAHFADCNDCLDILVSANEMLTDEEISECKPASKAEAVSVMKHWGIYNKSFGKNYLTVFLQRIYEFLSQIFMPQQPAAVRSPALCRSDSPGDSESKELNKKFDTFGITISYDRFEKGKDVAEITVSVFGISSKVIRLSLENDKKGKDSRPFRGQPEIFEKVPFGIYRIIIRKENLEEKSISFLINEAGIHEC